MLAERTFWEKATAAHVFCQQQRARGERLSRHWHDLARLDDTEYADQALADWDLALSVARHKAMFFRENDADRNLIDYVAAVSGGLQLVPDEPARSILADDYARMVRSRAGCSLTTPRSSTPSWNDAPTSRSGPTLETGPESPDLEVELRQ